MPLSFVIDVGILVHYVAEQRVIRGRGIGLSQGSLVCICAQA